MEEDFLYSMYSDPYGGYEPFVNGSAEHLCVFPVWIALGCLIVWLAKRFPKTERGISIALSATCLLSLVMGYIVLKVELAHPSWGLVWYDMLPLHYCSIMEFIAPLALVLRWQWARAVLYFGALTATTQALLTPALPLGAPSLMYFTFFLSHGVVVFCALYMVFAQHWSPRKYDIWRALGFGALYMICVHPFNCLWGTNYGFTRFVPMSGSVLDWLGPWPIYCFTMFIPAWGIMWLLQLPWRKRLRAED